MATMKTTLTAIDRLLAGAVEREALPGAVAVVAGPEGVRHVAVAGTMRAGGDRDVREDTTFRLMSLTKALTSVAALQLIERGCLGLDQEVTSVLPAFGDLPVLDGFDGDTPRLRPPAGPTTIRHLLTHTSGLAYAFANGDLRRYLNATGTPDAISGRHDAIAIPLVADPGTAWNYGVSTDWLGQVVEAISGQDLAAYLAEHVLDPLGMHDTAFAPTEEQRERMMAVHRRTPGGGLAAEDFELPSDPEFAPGGHGAYGTALDYGRFLSALLGGGTLDGARIVAPETVDMALTDHLGGLPLPQVTQSMMPQLSNDIIAMPFKQSWGLGFHLTLEDVPGRRRAGTGDWAGLMNCYYWIDRASGIAAVLCTQVLPFFDGPILETMMAFEQAVYEHGRR
jgi:CubicO group peptidase (beta-lactamase class C family)